ncbi:MAG: hypothetical protein AAFP96_04385, partial [Bacteroidota bacterium]
WEIEKIKNYHRYTLVQYTGGKLDGRTIGGIKFSNILFNDEQDLACVFVEKGSGADCAEGFVIFLSKKKKWEIDSIKTLWVS